MEIIEDIMINDINTKPDPLTRKRLFNPHVKENTKVILGETSNILDLANVTKDDDIFHKLVDKAYSQNWLPHKVSMGEDAYDYKHKLTDDERASYDDILSFLAFLDSIQTNNLPNIASYVTNPSIVYFLARQTWDEAIHSKSYGWIFTSIMSKEKSKELYYKWKTNKTLLERNEFIADIYQNFIDTPCTKNFLRSVVANYLLEGIYFYNAFQFFHNLNNRGLMLGTDTQISYIQRDEIIHCLGFENILKLIFKENPNIKEDYNDMINQMFTEAVNWEIKFSSETIGDKILGITTSSIIDYTYYLGNKRLKAIGLEEIFDKKKNPYKHLVKSAGVEDETSNRTNNFEGTSITYKSPEILTGWDELGVLHKIF
jgi:ribonucleoside-diphosphate reductase beta chain